MKILYIIIYCIHICIVYIHVYAEKIKNIDWYFVALEFNDNCTNTGSCNSLENLACRDKKCLCISSYYHKDQVCYASMCIHLKFLIFLAFLN